MIWAAAAEAAGNAIGAVNPNWLVFVEGIGSYNGDNYWWGGNLVGVRDRPIELDVGHKLVYSAHDYPNSVYAQPWFQSPDFAAQLPAVFDKAWGYIYREGIAPVYVGEFGTKLVDPKDAPWLEALTSYMSGDFDNNGTIDIPAGQQGMSWTYWSWNPNSNDTGGILKDDWSTVNENKVAYLRPIEFDFHETGGGTGDHNVLSFVVSLSAPATEAVTVGYHTVAGDATASDFTATSGTLTFAVGEQSKTVQVSVTADLLHEGNEHFQVVLTDAHGAVIGSATATGTIIDDDGPVGGSGNDHLTGTGGDDILPGNGGNDTLDGNAGNDRLDGGDGNDTLIGGAGADTLVGGAGTDTASYTPSTGGVNVNLATGLGVAFEAQGDTLTGIEILIGGSGNDWLRGDGNANTLTGNAGNDTLQGFGGLDTLNGGDGNDVLYGGAGKDTLTGGIGADKFVFSATSDSPVGGSSTSDAITDFSHAQGDRIDLSAIDANSGAAGDQAFSFIGAVAFAHHAGELRADTVAGVTSVYGDVNGDGTADFQIRLSGTIVLVAADFAL